MSNQTLAKLLEQRRGVRLIDGIPVWGDPVDPGAMTQIKNVFKSATKVALMADHHKGYSMPVGGVAAYDGAVSPSGVGYDIGCGNKAVLTDAKIGDFDVSMMMDTIWKELSFGIGRKNKEKINHALFDDPAWQVGIVASLRDKAAEQLGTIGSGNHYVDILADEHKRIWIGVHFGSRGFGHGIATYYLKAGGYDDKNLDSDAIIFDVFSDLGAEYLEGMRLAGQYAYAGRDWVCAKVAQLMGAKILEEVHNHHNYASLERHGDKQYWVVRKGATPAFPGQKGFVGGSMGDMSVILEGKMSPESVYSLNSTVHGAGRVMSRTQAAGKMRHGDIIRKGLVSREMMAEWLAREKVELRGGGVDESPHVYKRLPEVLRWHRKGVKILHRLKPLGVAMADPREKDPFKD